jgi:hypothetical protein
LRLAETLVPASIVPAPVVLAPVVLAAIAVAWAGAPSVAGAQEVPQISVPITLTDDAGGEASPTLGLDPETTDGTDEAFGEERSPPFPPGPSSLVARWIDEDLGGGSGLSGFPDTGMEIDIRQGGGGFGGTKAHEIRFGTGEDASEITFSWALPQGMTGTLQDQTALGRGNELDEEMSGEGNATLTNLNVTKAIVTLQYDLNASAIVGKRVSADGRVDFGATGAAIGFSGVGGSGIVTVERFESGPSGTDGIPEENISSYRLVIGATGNLNFGDETELRLAVGELGGISNPGQVTIYRRPAEGTGSFSTLSATVDDGGTPADISDDELVAKTGSFSEFVLASDSDPLPVELASFEGALIEGKVRLTWETASEANNAGFEVQRKAASKPDAAWTEVGFVESNAPGGTTEEPQSYRFTDEELPFAANRVEYRLKQVDQEQLFGRDVAFGHNSRGVAG